MADKITALTEQDKQHLLNKSAKALPDNPTDKGFSADQIKKSIYEPSIILFSFLSRLAQEVANMSDDYYEKADTYSKTKIDEELAKKVDIEAGKSLIPNTKIEKLDGIESGAQANVLEGVQVNGTDQPIVGKKVNVDISGKLDKKSGSSYKNIVYGTNYEGSQTTIPVDDFPGGDGSIARRSAQTGHIGQIEVPLTPILNTEASSKKYVDDNKTVISDTLNDTSTTKALSANQGKVLKGLIDSIMALLQSNDTDLDTIQEIVTYIKGNKTLIDSITTTKVNISDIIDNLTSEIVNKPLSAKQGFVLKGLIDTLTSNVYNKAGAESMVDSKIAGITAINSITDQDNTKVYDYRIIVRGERIYLGITDITESE